MRMDNKGALFGILAVFLVILIIMGVMIGKMATPYKEQEEYYEDVSELIEGNYDNIGEVVTQNNIESNKNGSLLYKSGDGFYFTIKNKKVTFPMLYNTFANDICSEGLPYLNKQLGPNEKTTITINVGNDELKISITNFDSEKTCSYGTCFITEIEAKPSKTLKIKGISSDRVGEQQLINAYGKCDIGSNTYDDKFLYYKTSKSMMNKTIGVEFTLDAITGEVIYFVYGINAPMYAK